MPTDVVFWTKLAGKLAVAPLGAAALLGVVRFPRLPRPLRFLVGVVFFALAMELTALLLQAQHRPNLFLIPLDAVGAFCLLALVYGWALQSAAYWRWLPWVAGAFALYAALSSGLPPDATRFRPGVQVLEAVLVLGLVALYFRKLLHELHVRHLHQEPLVWVSVGLLGYYLGKMQIALFSNYMLQHYSGRFNLVVWSFHSLLTCLLYLCYCRALWIRPQK